jgi:hypothetical protein
MLTEGGISPTHVGLHVSNYMYHLLQDLKRQCIPPHGDANIDVKSKAIPVTGLGGL